VLAQSGLPNEVDILIVDDVFNIEKLDQFARFLDELMVVVIDEENLE